MRLTGTKSPIGLANIVTLLRLACIFIAGYFVISYSPERDYYRLMAFGVIIVAGISDILDGIIARRLGQVTYAGHVLDIITDALGFTVGFVLLYLFDLGQRFPLWFVTIVVGRELIVYGLYAIVMVKNGSAYKKTTGLSKVNTLMLGACILALLLRFEYSWVLWVITTATTTITGLDNVLHAIKLLRYGNIASTAPE
jgi:phosphatidylglycerophosphate synthase